MSFDQLVQVKLENNDENQQTTQAIHFKKDKPKFDIFQNYKNQKIKKIAKLIPNKKQITTGPQQSPFNLIEDMIILVCSNYYGREILFAEESEYIHGSCLTLNFWSKIINHFAIDRTTDAMRSRFTRIISKVHPKEYDQYIDLLERGLIDYEVKYCNHSSKQFMSIKKIREKDYLQKICQNSFKKKQKQENVNQSTDNSQIYKRIQQRKDEIRQKEYIKKVISKEGYRYLNDDFYDEKEVIIQLVRNYRYIDQKGYAKEWIEANKTQLKWYQKALQNEIQQMNIECDYLETWKQNYDLKENECNKIVEEIQRKKKKELEILYLENLNEKEKKNLGIIENERQNKILEINVDELEVGQDINKIRHRGQIVNKVEMNILGQECKVDEIDDEQFPHYI